jgi:hypothetical protein
VEGTTFDSEYWFFARKSQQVGYLIHTVHLQFPRLEMRHPIVAQRRLSRTWALSSSAQDAYGSGERVMPL